MSVNRWKRIAILLLVTCPFIANGQSLSMYTGMYYKKTPASASKTLHPNLMFGTSVSGDFYRGEKAIIGLRCDIATVWASEFEPYTKVQASKLDYRLWGNERSDYMSLQLGYTNPKPLLPGLYASVYSGISFNNREFKYEGYIFETNDSIPSNGFPEQYAGKAFQISMYWSSGVQLNYQLIRMENFKWDVFVRADIMVPIQGAHSEKWTEPFNMREQQNTNTLEEYKYHVFERTLNWSWSIGMSYSL